MQYTRLANESAEYLAQRDDIEVLRDDGIPTRVVFSSIPENLRAQPTLSVTVDAAGGGARDVTLSYLTTGLSWKADYVALFDEKAGTVRYAALPTPRRIPATGSTETGSIMHLPIF